MIYERRNLIKRVRFSRGYTKTTREYSVEKIDIGPCLIAGWTGDFIRIHFSDTE